MPSEFGLIARFFTRPSPSATLGIGDDAALLKMSAGMELVVSADTLVAGTHFLHQTDPRKLGWKTLAVNVSDFAAMGARPRWAVLAITLPQADEDWLAAFADGFFECAAQYGIELVGGDTTRGPLAMSVTLLGEVPPRQALRRDAARPGDEVWVSGSLGAAALGLAALQGKVKLDANSFALCLHALETPQPRLVLGSRLRKLAHAAIDVSDGLLADLGHILERSNAGAVLHFDALPIHPALSPWRTESWAQACLLAGGDDYELCFTASPRRRTEIADLAAELGIPLTPIGHITATPGLRLLDAHGHLLDVACTGYDHFA
ncbi:MAG: thiamine-phosphate kinase [Methylophilaceae bacterium]|nr:thiamine-phosphate kinase [Methylophilaceae bacterium]